MDRKHSLLIVDDDPFTLRFLRTLLERAGYLPFLALDGQNALSLIVEKSPDLMLLDIGLPDVDGWEVCRRVRQFSSLPIIVLSGRDTDADKARALRAGADDYITKPFLTQDLLVRIETVLRRSEKNNKSDSESSFSDGRLSLDFVGYSVKINGTPVPLSALEFRLLRELVCHRNKVLTPGHIFSQVWGWDEKESNGMLRTGIWRLRQAIEEDIHHPRYIRGVRGVGYMFCGEPQQSSPWSPSFPADFTPPLLSI